MKLRPDLKQSVCISPGHVYFRGDEIPEKVQKRYPNEIRHFLLKGFMELESLSRDDLKMIADGLDYHKNIKTEKLIELIRGSDVCFQ